MSCSRATQVQRYHDGELSPTERTALEGHLPDCAECRELLAELHSLSAVIERVPLADMPTKAVSRLKERWAQGRDRGIIRVAGWLTAAAAAVLIGALLRGPAEPAQMAAGPALWETLAVTPLADVQDEATGDLEEAQWMADELSSGETW